MSAYCVPSILSVGMKEVFHNRDKPRLSWIRPTKNTGTIYLTQTILELNNLGIGIL